MSFQSYFQDSFTGYLVTEPELPVFEAGLFNIDLWTGDSSIRSIVNGLDYQANNALVWIKRRSSITDHGLFDTVRGAVQRIESSTTSFQVLRTGALTSFNIDGFSLGAFVEVNSSGETYVAWSFFEDTRVLDIITYTGDGAASRAIPHNLGAIPGMAIAKRLDAASSWPVQHNTIPATSSLFLNTVSPATVSATMWSNTNFNATDVTIGSNVDINALGGTYVMYVFANDTAGDGVVQCGSYKGTGLAGQKVFLGWEPRFVLVKRSVGSNEDWLIFDTARDTDSLINDALFPNRNFAEANQATGGFNFVEDGFITLGVGNNAASNTYVYMALR